MIQKSDPQDMVSDTNGNNLYYDIYIYIYIERERERYLYLSLYTHICI